MTQVQPFFDYFRQSFLSDIVVHGEWIFKFSKGKNLLLNFLLSFMYLTKAARTEPLGPKHHVVTCTSPVFCIFYVYHTEDLWGKAGGGWLEGGGTLKMMSQRLILPLAQS